MKRSSNSYIGTYDYRDAGGMLEIEKIRDAIKAVNKLASTKDKYAAQRAKYYGEEIPMKSPVYYVKLQGRFGKNNPNIDKYTHWTRFNEKYTDYSICRLEDAERVDVYVYERQR